MKKTEYESHPSYGLLGFSRVMGGNPKLFGSSIPHTDKIVMKLKHAKTCRDLSRQWYFGEGLIAEVEMSYSQFAEAITTMNVGEGIPVTILYTEKDGKTPECDFELKRRQYEEELSEQIKEANKNVNELIASLKEMFEKPRLNKADKEQILSTLNKVSMDIGCNSTYIMTQFNEQMDKSVMEAKNEIEAFTQYKLNALGLEKLEELKSLPEKNENS